MKKFKLLTLILCSLLTYFIYMGTKDKNNITYISLGDDYDNYLTNYLTKNNKLYRSYKYINNEMLIRDLKKDIEANEKIEEGEYLKKALREAKLLTISIGKNDLLLKREIGGKTNKEIVDEVLKEQIELMKVIRKYYKYDIYLIGYNKEFKDSRKYILEMYRQKEKGLQGVSYINNKEQLINKINKRLEI